MKAQKATSNIHAIQTYYKARAAGYDAEASWTYRNRKLINFHVELLRPQADEIILDLATGTGAVGEVFVTKSRSVIGIDLSAEMLGVASGRLSSVVLGTAHLLPFPAGSFDAVVCRQGLHYMDVELALGEIRRITKSRVLISQIISHEQEDSDWWWSIFRILTPDRQHVFTVNRLNDLLRRAGFSLGKTTIYQERTTLNGWLQGLQPRPETRRRVYRAFFDAPERVKSLYEFEFFDDDVYYTHTWAFLVGFVR